MLTQTSLEHEVAKLIVDTLNLEDIQPEDIIPDAPLFNNGLGLDSIDALEIALSISMKYGVQIKSDDSNNVQVFSNLKSLSEHINEKRSQ